MKIYLYNNLHYGDFITNRAIIEMLLRYEEITELSVGCYQNMRYLIDDLPINKYVVKQDDNWPQSTDLRLACPPDHICINTHCGTFTDFSNQFHHNWINIVKTVNRQFEMHNIAIKLPENRTPMIDFHIRSLIRIRPNSIYVENGQQRSWPSNFEFDIDKYARAFPLANFYCTSNPNSKEKNIVDGSQYNLIELSAISNECIGIMGKGSGPFLCTYTTPNRYKKRAVFGYDTKLWKKFWEYDDNPLEYLYTEEEAHKFIEQTLNQEFVSL